MQADTFTASMKNTSSNPPICKETVTLHETKVPYSPSPESTCSYCVICRH